MVRRRHETAFARLPAALDLADSALFFDNSALQPVMLMAVAGGAIIETHLDRNQRLHLRLAEAVAASLHVDGNVVLDSPADGSP